MIGTEAEDFQPQADRFARWRQAYPVKDRWREHEIPPAKAASAPVPAFSSSMRSLGQCARLAHLLAHAAQVGMIITEGIIQQRLA
jgi:hypothetical protein